MEIIIDYESSWRNSFLDGSNNEQLPKNGRNFIASMSELKKEGNYIKRDVTKDTVMGILNRLIGDQRKLYQARSGQYFFKDIEPLVEFDDRKMETGEIVYIRNMNGSTDQNSFSGMIKADEPMFKSDYSNGLWSVLKASFDELCQFILEEDFELQLSHSFEPLQICAIFEELGKLKPVPNEDTALAVIERLSGIYPDESYLNNKGLVIPSMIYCAALYIQLERLSFKYDVSSARTKSGGLSGISKRSFTKKDFMKRFTTGNGKIIWGNPYMKKEKIKGLGEVTSTLTKASGQLYITLNVEKEKAVEIKQMIESAGVSSFYLGKKGLAYVSSIRL